MKKTLSLIALVGAIHLGAKAQVIDEKNGKTYYYFDSINQKQVKEIFHHIAELQMFADNQGNMRDTMILVKSGPYTKYFENGTLECSGTYDRGTKTGVWKHYNNKGKLIRTEQWTSDKMIKKTTH